jgi:hypothetical protein
VRALELAKVLMTGSFLAVMVCGLHLLASAQGHAEKDQILWKETLTAAAKGTRIAPPKSILKEVKSDPDSCLNPSSEETVNVEVFRWSRDGFVMIAVWGRSSCFCSPTGNCAFWLYRSRSGTNELLLQTDMVQEFGFLPSTTKGAPDLVLWAHDSADRFPGALWKFDGAEYVSKCSWEVVSTFEDGANGVARRVENHIESNTCKLRLVPEREKASE